MTRAWPFRALAVALVAAGLLSVFGEPYQVGLDSGDQTWRWLYARTSTSGTMTKDFTVRFNANGTVKSYAFTSNVPEDMKKLG